MKIDVAVKNNFGFGGTNGTLVFKAFRLSLTDGILAECTTPQRLPIRWGVLAVSAA
jgi:hypothetical protein